MITLLEVLALVTLAGFAFAFFRKRIRRGSALALVLTGMCGVLGLAAPAGATEMRKGDYVEVHQDEQIKGDVYLTGHRARVDGTVDGDVFLFSQDATVEGHIKGDLIAFCQALRVSGQVDGNIRSFSNNVTMSGTIGKNFMTFDEVVNIDPKGKIGGGLTAFAETLSLDGKVGRDLLIFAKEARIAGTVEGEIRAKGETLSFSSTAQVDGPVKFEGEKEPEVSGQAKLASPVQFTHTKHRSSYRESKYYVWQVIWAAAFIIFGMVLLLVMPEFSKDAVRSAEQYGASAGVGTLVLFGVPIAGCVACVTVVGLFVGISTLFLWYAALYYAQVIVGGLIGQWLMGRTSETWPLIGRMTVGILLVRLATIVPHVGGWIKLAAILWGLGAISLALYRRFQPAIAANMPAAPLPPTTTVGGMQPA